jgi:glucose dehydrogenase
MLFHVSSYSLVYLAAGLVTFVTGSLAWKRRLASGGIWLFLAILAAGIWSMADFMDASSYGMLVKTF